MSVRLNGLAVTPEGNPLTDTVTLPAKPFSGLAVTETGFPGEPAVRLRLAGTTVSEKSGAAAAALTVRAIVAVWVRLPELPVTVTVAVPALADAPAVRVTF